MSSMTDYLENKLVDNFFRTTTFSRPATLYIALYTTSTTDAGGGTEVTGGSYARQALNPLDTNWYATQGGTTGASSGTGGATSNAAEVAFPVATANWGTITNVAIMDASTSGNMLFHGALTVSKTVNSGDQFKFSASNLSVTLA